jgi:RimJ/RimL family protein N-acetyltransferase
MCIAETARLRLRHLTSDDAPFILELLNDADFVANVGDRGIHSLDDARRYIATGPVASYTRYGFGLYLVEVRDSGLPIGICGLLRRDTHPDVEIGFATLPRARRQGYTLEAAEAAMQLGIEACGLQRVVAITAPHNLYSIRILERLGLKLERTGHFTAGGAESCIFAFDSKSGAGPRT